jgi:hypothetical protein
MLVSSNLTPYLPLSIKWRGGTGGEVKIRNVRIFRVNNSLVQSVDRTQHETANKN